MFVLLGRWTTHKITIGSTPDPNETRRRNLLDDGYNNESAYGNLNKDRFIKLSLSTYNRELGQLGNEIRQLEIEANKIKDPQKQETLRNKIFALKELKQSVEVKINEIENTKDTDKKFKKLKALNEFVDGSLGDMNKAENSNIPSSPYDVLKTYAPWLLGNDSVKDALEQGNGSTESNNNGSSRGLGTLFEKLWTNFNKMFNITRPIKINFPRL